MSGPGARDSEKPAESLAPAASLEREHADDAGAVEIGARAVEIGACERRVGERLDVLWSVDCETEDTFLYAAITNISEMGIFVRTTEPLAVGTQVTLRFAPPREREPFALDGIVQWVNAVRLLDDNPNPGMGIRFSCLTLPDRERIVEAVRTIAYLREEPRQRARTSN
jgi:type IV pilus assembly protein PilZ